MAGGWLGESLLGPGRLRKEAPVQHQGRAGRRRPDRAPPPAGHPDCARPRGGQIGTRSPRQSRPKTAGRVGQAESQIGRASCRERVS